MWQERYLVLTVITISGDKKVYINLVDSASSNVLTGIGLNHNNFPVVLNFYEVDANTIGVVENNPSPELDVGDIFPETDSQILKLAENRSVSVEFHNKQQVQIIKELLDRIEEVLPNDIHHSTQELE